MIDNELNISNSEAFDLDVYSNFNREYDPRYSNFSLKKFVKDAGKVVKNVGGGIKKGVEAVKDKADDIIEDVKDKTDGKLKGFGQKVGSGLKTVGGKVEGFAKKVGKGFARISGAPLRAAFLLAVKKFNIFGIATRLAPALIDSPKFKPTSKVKAKSALAKVKNMWRKAGGNLSKLDDAIREGYNKKSKSKKWIEKYGESSFDGGEKYSNAVDPASAAIWTAAISTFGAVTVSIINKSGVDKNPYIDPSEAPDGLDDATTEGDKQPSLDGDLVYDPETGELIIPPQAEKILGMPKNVAIGVGIGAGTLLLAGIVYLAVRKPTPVSIPKIAK